jgi:hypothetical protein
MKLSISRTVDYSGLEAGVSVAKRDRGCHYYTKVVLRRSVDSS